MKKVFSGPPIVGFSFRHWGRFTGKFRENQGENQTLNMYGFAVVRVNESLKIQHIQIYYKPEDFLLALEGKLSASDLERPTFYVGNKLPYISTKKEEQSSCLLN